MSDIQNTGTGDLTFIFQLFEAAILYQKSKGFPVWYGYDKDIIRSDIAGNLQFKVTDKNETLCVFSIYFTDKIIWGEREKSASARRLH